MCNYLNVALIDFFQAVKKNHLALMLGWQDIKQRYRRSKLGPFWITISMAVMIGMIGIVFGQVLNMPMQEYLPYLATGMILWTFFSTSVTEGSNSFIDSQGMIRQLCIPLSIYPMRVLWRNVIICVHNAIILPFVFVAVGRGVNVEILWLIPGFLIFAINAYWISLFLSVFCTRFRDMPQIISSLLQVFFYVTPVIWMPNALTPRSANMLVDTNPVFHLMQLVRSPLLGSAPSVLNFCVGISMAIFGCFFAFLIFGKYKKRIAYWL